MDADLDEVRRKGERRLDAVIVTVIVVVVLSFLAVVALVATASSTAT